MDDDGLNMPNWGYYEPPPKGSLSLQLMPTLADRNTKSFLSTREGSVMVNANTAFHHPRDCVASNAPIFPMDYMRNSWGNQRDKFLNVLPPGNHNYAVLPSPGTPHHLQMFQPFDVPRDNGLVKMEDLDIKKEVDPVRRSAGGSSTLKTPKLKKPKKSPGMPKDKGAASVRQVKQAKKNMDMVVNGISMDISAIPIPVCSCTGTPQQCYRWGCGGWQSACCTTSLSMHPLPMSAKRRGSRIAGRKMSQGAFKKVLERLAAEGYNFRNPIDLRTHWAKHGTNKYVTIK